ncbi:hypothetical protein SK128_005490 [Halocaridina rubra]|uniref:EGF-like domain-containing protein n=1 Tax=Halocaridina rubra TaxID=373956 RepID=A0AAN8XMY6_HALRR
MNIFFSLSSLPCGTLFCRPLLVSKPTLKGSYYHGSSGNDCFYILGDDKIPSYYWLSPDGSPCGADKMCINQRCESIQFPNGVTECPRNCSNRGSCNSRGNCHCNSGYAPPDCAGAGHGGSYDSNSVVDPRYKKPIQAGILLLFAILLPIISCICCCWGKINKWWEKRGQSRMANSCPGLTNFLNCCCCFAMNKITLWLVTVGKKEKPNKQEIDQVVDDEEAATFCQVGIDMKAEAQTNLWGVADERLFTELVTITPKSSPDTMRKIRLPNNSPVLHHKSAEELDRIPPYQQSISVDSGCISDQGEVNDHQPVSSQMSMTSLIGAICRFGKGSVTNNPAGKDSNRRSRVMGSQKSIPLSRFVVDPLAGNTKARLKTPPPENIRPSFSRSLSTDAAASMRIHPRGPPQPPPKALKPHKSDENLHKVSKVHVKRISFLGKTAASDENILGSVVSSREAGTVAEKKPMLPPQRHDKKQVDKSAVITALPPLKKMPKEKEEASKQKPFKDGGKPENIVPGNTEKRAMTPPKLRPVKKGIETDNDTTKAKQIPPPVVSLKGNKVKALAMKLEQM